MALTKLTAALDKISSLATLITGQATTVKGAFDHDVNVVKDYINEILIPEVEDKFETKEDLATNRKLSPTGDFTGTWGGKTMVETDPGIQIVVNEHTSQLASTVKSVNSILPDVNGNVVVNASNYIVVKDFGAIGDGVADDTVAIQTALDTLVNGGTLFFPQGTYLTTSALIIKYPNIRLEGTGKRNPEVPLSLYDETVPSTIYVGHLGNGILMSHTYDINGFQLNKITLACSTTARASIGIAFDLGGLGAFRRDFLIENATITGFNSALGMIASSVESGSSETSMGMLRIINCSIMHNSFISQNTYGQWNGFIFENNDAGQNGYLVGQGGISLKGHTVSICNNILEGIRDPIFVEGNFRGLVIKNNYFEACVGLACINVWDSLQSYDIGSNTFLACTTTHKVIINYTGGGRCTDPYWSNCVGKMDQPILGELSDEFKLNNNDGATGYCRIDTPVPQMKEKPKKSTAYETGGTLFNQSSKSPFGNYNIPVFRYTTSGAGSIYNSIPLTASIGQWIIISWTCKRKSASALPGHLAAYINAAAGNGSMEYPLIILSRYYTDNEWFVVTAALKTTVAVTSLALTLFPFGNSPTAGLIADMILPTILVVDDINSVEPYCNEEKSFYITAAPTEGTWEVGDKVYAKTPLAGGYTGWICITSGTPGTWKGFGLIQA